MQIFKSILKSDSVGSHVSNIREVKHDTMRRRQFKQIPFMSRG